MTSCVRLEKVGEDNNFSQLIMIPTFNRWTFLRRKQIQILRNPFSNGYQALPEIFPKLARENFGFLQHDQFRVLKHFHK